MSPSISLNSQNTYEIQVHGQPDDSRRAWFGDTLINVETLEDTLATTVFNVVMDQAGLVGLIRRLHGLGIVLLSVRLVA